MTIWLFVALYPPASNYLPKAQAKIRMHLGENVEELGRTLLGGRFEIFNKIGYGGMAVIFHALDLNLQREVAIKILHDSLIQDPAFQASFLQEARLAANLAHPNIVTIFDFGHDSGRYYLVMEYISGTDLKKLIRQRSRLPIDEALELMIQVCSGVGYAHRAGLIHCDLKPQNILVGIDGRAKITDFGISRALASIRPDEHVDTVWGSPLYLAPEQASGDPPSPATDVYALGVTLFEMLAGIPPFDANDSQTLFELHQSQPPPSVRDYEPTISTTLEKVLFKVLSKEPSARYRTADQFGRVLINLREHLPSIAPVPEPPPPSLPIRLPNILKTRAPRTSLGDIDWIAVTLGLMAFIAVSGLIPLWLWVCLLYPSCPINPW
jgi:serine/threonine-protein kinase